MKLYVIEYCGDEGVLQIGCCSSRQLAESKCKKMNQKGDDVFVSEYKSDKNGWINFH